MTTIDRTGASDAEFEARIAPFEADDRVEPGLSAESNGRRLAWFTDDELHVELTRRAALTSPAPAPPHPVGRCGDPSCGGDW